MTVWKLHGLCYREMAIVARMLTELAAKGEVEGTKFDLDTLEIHFNENTGDVDLVDGYGHTTAEVTYKIIQFFEDNSSGKTIQTGLTLKEAQEICNHPESSSYTAVPPRGCGGDEDLISEWHKTKRHWFYGYTREEDE